MMIKNKNRVNSAIDTHLQQEVLVIRRNGTVVRRAKYKMFQNVSWHFWGDPGKVNMQTEF